MDIVTLLKALFNQIEMFPPCNDGWQHDIMASYCIHHICNLFGIFKQITEPLKGHSHNSVIFF